jgi:CheY-like chemotaxis protein
MRHTSLHTARRDGLDFGRATRRRFLSILPAVTVCPAFVLRNQLNLWTRPSCTQPRRSQQLVYIVDDEEDILGFYRLFFKEAGIEVRTFCDRAEALRAFQSARTQPVLLVTDYVGYPISAEQLMSECRRIQPDLKILMVSGCPTDYLSFDKVQPDRFLPKPFRLEQLLVEVRALSGAAIASRSSLLQGF